jgi:hypothetical protein
MKLCKARTAFFLTLPSKIVTLIINLFFNEDISLY